MAVLASLLLLTCAMIISIEYMIRIIPHAQDRKGIPQDCTLLGKRQSDKSQRSLTPSPLSPANPDPFRPVRFFSQHCSDALEKWF